MVRTQREKEILVLVTLEEFNKLKLKLIEETARSIFSKYDSLSEEDHEEYRYFKYDKDPYPTIIHGKIWCRKIAAKTLGFDK